MNEPSRINFLDTVKLNLRVVNHKAFFIRMVCLGEYFGTPDDFNKEMENIIKQISSQFKCDDPNGLLLTYPQYFLHILEASEEFIYRHFQAILNNITIKLGRIIVLPCQHHIYRTYFTGWYTTFQKPRVLLEKLEYSSLEDIEKQIESCLTKVHKLSAYVMNTAKNSNVQSVAQILMNLKEQVPEYLPESTVVEFLLTVQVPILKDVREYMKQYVTVPTISFYNDRIWPSPCDITPYDVFN